MQDRTGKTFATHGAVFIPTDAGVIGMGLVGGLVGLVAGGAVGVVTALVLLARGKRNQTA